MADPSGEVSLDQIEREWTRALARSGLPKYLVELVLCDAEHNPRRFGAVWMRPHFQPPVEYFFGDGRAWQLASTPPAVHRNRIALPMRFPAAGAGAALPGGILAHELYHVVTYERGGRLSLQLQPVVEQVLAELHGGSIPGTVINAIPYEADANAFAAQYLRRFHREAIPAMLAGDDAALARPTAPPPDPLTLQRRTVAFIHERVADLGRPLRLPLGPKSLVHWLELASPGAAVIWRELERAAA